MSIFYSLLADSYQLLKFMLQREWSDRTGWINKKSIIWRWPGAVSRSGPGEHVEKQRCHACLHHLHQHYWYTHTHTWRRVEKSAISSQTETLHLHNLSSSHAHHNSSISRNSIDSRADSDKLTFLRTHTIQPYQPSENYWARSDKQAATALLKSHYLLKPLWCRPLFYKDYTLTEKLPQVI